jgi:methylase of polypeptide subunit release factors
LNQPIFDVRDSEEYARMREVLLKADYHEKGLIGVLGPIQLPTRAGKDLPHFLHLTRAGRPLDTLLRLFVAGAPVVEAAARDALAPLALETWVRAGLVGLRDGMALGRVRLLPCRGLVLACDYADSIEPGGTLEQVMGLTASSMTLADFRVPRPCRAALDVGSGSGIQSLLAAAHSQQVWGVDCTRRSIEFARFNAGLNGIANCEFIEGNAFEPVRGRTFDLVISNPPFAVTPSVRYIYRDSGVELDGFCRRLVRQAPEFLNEGGMFQICCDWVHLAGGDWKERLAGWFEGSGCDVWALRFETQGAADYARVWVRDTEHETEEASARLYEEWLAYYEAKGVEAVSTGVIAMRRASGRANWVRIEEMPDGAGGPVGEAVAAGFELRDYLDTVRADEALLGEKLRVSPLVRLEDICEPAGGTWRVTSASIRLLRGLTYSSPVDLRLAGLIARCDGERPVRDLMVELATTTNSDLEKITPNCLSLLRQLVERGFLLPVRK